MLLCACHYRMRNRFENSILYQLFDNVNFSDRAPHPILEVMLQIYRFYVQMHLGLFTLLSSQLFSQMCRVLKCHRPFSTIPFSHFVLYLICTNIVLVIFWILVVLISDNRGFSKWNFNSVSAWQNDLNIEAILVPEFVNSERRITPTKFVWSDPYFWIHGFRNKNQFNI